MRKLLLILGCCAACDRGASPATTTQSPTFASAAARDSAAGFRRDSVARAGRGETLSGRPVAARPVPSEKKPEIKRFVGAYRRGTGVEEFRPCGRQVALPLGGRPEAIMLLRDRFRWHAVWMERPLFAVFHGAIVDDTTAAKPAARADSTGGGRHATAAQRFLLTGVDSLRSWQPGDCGGDRPPGL